jgi:hypothetical protein
MRRSATFVLPEQSTSTGMSTLREYVLHAERYGSEAVLETASRELEIVEQGRLCLVLRHMKGNRGGFKLAPAERERLTDGLIQEGMSSAAIADLLGVTKEYVQGRKRGLKTQQTWGSKTNERATLMDSLPVPILGENRLVGEACV